MAAGKHPPAWSRFLRRLWRPFLTAEEKARIARAIAEAESRTTGEIRVHVSGRLRGADPLEAAAAKFAALGLHKTRGRNGVLILISDLDHRFAIWGDAGIHGKAGAPLWEKAKETLRSHFAQRRYAEGIEACVREVGRELALHFPKDGPGPGRNELSNEVSQD